VAFKEDGEKLVGEASKNQVGNNPTNTLYDVRAHSMIPSAERYHTSYVAPVHREGKGRETSDFDFILKEKPRL
jgi:molecular chaperone DnaK (HSP70)